MSQPRTLQHCFALPALKEHFAKTPSPAGANALLDLPGDILLDTEDEINVITGALWILCVKYDKKEENDRPKDLELLRKAVSKLSNKVEPPFAAWSVDQIQKDVGAMMEELLAKTLPPQEKAVDLAGNSAIFTNPYQTAQVQHSSARSTFASLGTSTGGYQVLFGGLPLDVSEKDIRDLLINPPLSLAASTTTVQSLFGSDGASLGITLVQVAHEVDSERIRREYSGQVIDGSYRLTVQHVLRPTQPLPAPSVTPFNPPEAPKAATKAAQPKTQVKPGAKGKAPAAPSGKPPGLALLGRMSKGGASGQTGPNTQQLTLLAKQKANLKAGGKPGAALLSRLAGDKTRAAVKGKPTTKAQVAGKQKVARAKQNMAMDVDKPVAQNAKEKPKKATQAELDEEMRAYERARRFAA